MMFRFPLQEGITLGLVMLKDAPQLAEVIRANHEHLASYMSFASADYSEANAHEFLQRSLHKIADETAFRWLIFADDAIIGMISFNTISTRFGSADIGYWLAKEWTGRGIMIDAIRAITDYGFGTLGLQRIEILTDTENEKSANSALRAGYQFETCRCSWTYRNGQYRDLNAYVALADEWENSVLP